MVFTRPRSPGNSLKLRLKSGRSHGHVQPPADSGQAGPAAFTELPTSRGPPFLRGAFLQSQENKSIGGMKQHVSEERIQESADSSFRFTLHR